MPETQHTEGEWDFACDSYGKVRHSRKACVYTTIKTPTGDQLVNVASRIPSWEDARLMAASKEMYAALSHLTEAIQLNYGDMQPGTASYLRSIIEGEVAEAIKKASNPQVFTPATLNAAAS